MRQLATKEGRLKAQEYQFNRLIESGYKLETYNDLKIFTLIEEKSTLLKIFRGTAAHHIAYFKYRTPEDMQTGLKRFKDGSDRMKVYKKEAKENPTKSTAANCAAAIREELKTNFKGVKFSVTSENYAGGNSVRINWTNGPTADDVRSIAKKYQYGNFDGMTDMYEYSNSREDIPQAKYISESREMSEDIRAVLIPIIEDRFENIIIDGGYHYSAENILYRIFNKTSIPNGATITGLSELNGSGTLEDMYSFTFLLPETTEKEAQVFEAIKSEPGEINIIEYSDKSIAVIGNTKPIKDDLKALGGRFNFRLTCGAGWIFQKTKEAEVKRLLNL